MFKSKKFILLISILNFTVAQDSPFVGSWKLAPSAGAMKVGPNINDGSWWSSSGADVERRACLFDDEYVFSEDGTFQNILQDRARQESAHIQCHDHEDRKLDGHVHEETPQPQKDSQRVSNAEQK